MGSDKLWGGRFKNDIAREVFEFSRGDMDDYVLYSYDIMASIAHAKALNKAGIISDKEAEELISALTKLKEERLDLFEYDTEDIHSFVLERLKGLAPNSYEKLHSARSRNDLVAGASLLYVLTVGFMLIHKIRDLQKALVSRAKESQDIYMPSFTHLQDAQVISAGHYLLSWVEALDEVVADLQHVVTSAKSPLGACAGSGSAIPIDVVELAKDFHINDIHKNSLFAISDRSYYLRLLFAYAHLALVLSRLAEDWIIYSSQEFGFLHLPDDFCTGSSIMPHKKNPDVLELIRGRSAHVIGALNSFFVLIKGLPTAYNRDMQEDKAILLGCSDTLHSCVEVLTGLVEGISWNKEKLEKALANDFLYATDIMEELILNGMSWKDAHNKVGKLVLMSEEKGKRLSELNKGERESVLGDFNFPDKEWRGFFSPKRSVEAKKTFNSTSPESVKRQIAFWEGIFFEEEGVK